MCTSVKIIQVYLVLEEWDGEEMVIEIVLVITFPSLAMNEEEKKSLIVVG